MWERITAGLASLGDRAVGDGSSGSAPPQQSMDEEQLVEYEGMLVAASAAQRRRCCLPLHPPVAKHRDQYSPLPLGWESEDEVGAQVLLLR